MLCSSRDNMFNRSFYKGHGTLNHYNFNFVSKGIIKKFRSSHRRCSVEKGVRKNFENLTGKHLCGSFLLIKLQACNTLFSCEIRNFFRNTYFEQHLWTTAPLTLFNLTRSWSAGNFHLVIGWTWTYFKRPAEVMRGYADVSL